ncbi:hypothetical protein [Acidihalobacter prosperus]|uniref:hypothetical protein n=1 Tax=Acidihalobacter prosperus TaxID=160660 RepID=UPI0007EE32B2|nr:hypothetical protein [Acidihalobacter prosperus]
MKTHEVKAALRARFCAPEWGIFFEVADGTGANQRRWADAVSINLWPSRGLEIHGFEVKVSRSDWIRELKNPEKSEPVQRYCDRWWIVAPEGVIREGELPPTWGQYEVQKGDALRQVAAAPKLESKPVTREFVAAMLRRASGIDENEVRAAVRAEVEKQRANDRTTIEREIKLRTQKYERVMDHIATIERIAGVKLTEFTDSEEIGRAIRAVQHLGLNKTYGGLSSLRNDLRRMVGNLDQAIALFCGPEAETEDTA